VRNKFEKGYQMDMNTKQKEREILKEWEGGVGNGVAWAITIDAYGILEGANRKTVGGEKRTEQTVNHVGIDWGRKRTRGQNLWGESK